MTSPLEIIFEISALVISLGGLVLVFRREREKLLTEVIRMKSNIKSVEKYTEENKAMLKEMDSRQQMDRNEIEKMFIKDEYQEKRLDALNESIEKLHSRISSSEQRILAKLDSLR